MPADEMIDREVSATRDWFHIRFRDNRLVTDRGQKQQIAVSQRISLPMARSGGPTRDIVSERDDNDTMRFFSAGLIVGIGMGAFLDGIVLHQIAQWHNMGSAVVPPHTMEAMSRNMAWDGQFHLASWLITLAGVIALWRDRQANAPTLAVLTGQMIMGWGLFNFVEGLLNHHVLGLHHVRDLPHHVPAYDWLFLTIGGLGFLIVGAVLSRQRTRGGGSHQQAGLSSSP